MNQGLLVVLSGPSGAGKGTVCSKLLQEQPNLVYSVSVTTRAPRVGERNGVQYFFCEQNDFVQMRSAGELLEWAEVYGNYYGTPRRWVEDQLRCGQDVVLEIDIQGAMQVQQVFKDAVFIIIVPPNLTELERRIRHRGTETEETISRRMTSAREELSFLRKYDYVVLNDQVEKAAAAVKAILIAEKCRTHRNLDYLGGS